MIAEVQRGWLCAIVDKVQNYSRRFHYVEFALCKIDLFPRQQTRLFAAQPGPQVE
jgi:hypothetical protein